MKRFFILISMWGLVSCESSVTVDYNTIKAKNVILKGDDGREFKLTVVSDSSGNPALSVIELK